MLVNLKIKYKNQEEKITNDKPCISHIACANKNFSNSKLRNRHLNNKNFR